MRVVLDTNVLISGLAYPNSVPGKIVSTWDSHSLHVVMCKFQLQEIARVLAYPKIRKLLAWDDKDIEAFVRQLLLRVELIDINDITVVVPSDADDSPILATLIAASADILITGDRDLLSMSEQYPIETPSQFAQRL